MDARAALGIPADGLELTEWNKNHLGDLFYVPENAGVDKGSKTGAFLRMSNKLVRPLANQLAVTNRMLNQIIKCYIYHDSIEVEEISNQMPFSEKPALCKLEETKLNLQERWRGDEADPDSAVEYIAALVRNADQYPISIKIHPDASQRDVLSYVKSEWKRIEAAQVRYPTHSKKAVKNSKVNVNDQNKRIADFIYKNRALPLKEIQRKLSTDLGVTTKDHGEIGKIRSLEKKRRQS